MKGTFFSADFIKDSNQDLRLLELNTDTTVLNQHINSLDWSDLISRLQSNNITKVDVVYKPAYQQEVVNHLSQSLNASASFVTEFTEYPELIPTIYPTAPTDASDKYILRMAYDEGAIFDSTYCKENLNTYVLFATASNGGSYDNYPAGFYYSGSVGEYNTIPNNLNGSNIPDAVVKGTSEADLAMTFYKIGSGSNGQSDADRWSGFINENKATNKIVQQFHYHSSSLQSNKITSVRHFGIVHDDLTQTNLYSYKIPALFEIPADISSEVTSSYTNELGVHHFYEYATNFLKHDYNARGVMSTERIEMYDGSYKALSDVAIGETVKSYYISGSPQVETDYALVNWSYEGPFMPSGSHITGSEVIYKDQQALTYGGLVELDLGADQVYLSPGKNMLVYSTGSNKTSFVSSKLINHTDHYLIDIDNNLVSMNGANFYVTTDSLDVVEIDVEEADTYLISGSNTWNALVSHNAPCFVGGTKVETEYGQKNIEDIKVGDLVYSYNERLETKELKKVLGVQSKLNEVVVKYLFSDGSSLVATPDHPLLINKKGWASFDKIEVGDECKNHLSQWSTIESIERLKDTHTVYNLSTVKDNHTFYANQKVVHNRFSCFVAGTKISMMDGTTKNVEDIDVGDQVITWDEEKQRLSYNQVYEVLLPTTTNLVEYFIDGDITLTCTPDHPIYVNDYQIASLNPSATEENHIIHSEVKGIKIDDEFIHINESRPKLLAFDGKEVEETQVYQIRVEKDNNYFANNVLVHNK